MHVYSMHVDTPVYTGVHRCLFVQREAQGLILLLVLVSVEVTARHLCSEILLSPG